MENLTMRVQLEIYQGHNGTLRLSEEISILRPMTLEEAARVLTRFSELAREVKAAK